MVKILPEIRNFSGRVILASVTRICNDFCENFGQWGDEVKNLALDFQDFYWVYDPKNILTKEDKDKNLAHFN